MIFSTVLLALFITLALVPVFRGLAVRLRAVDMPNARKVHVAPMPKTGGLAMAAGALLPVMLWTPPDPLVRPLILAAGIIVVFGFLDDLKDLGYRAKFTAQLLAALIVVLYGDIQIRSLGALLPEGLLLPALVAVPLTVVVIVGVTNAVNLADGLDGLAGGISLLCFICIGCLAWQAGRAEVALIAAAVCGALFGFLRFNTHPASVFMGDAGSQLLGFLAITLALGLTQDSAPYSPLAPLLLLGLPVFDTLRVMTERIRKGVSPFKADRNHLHHKLMETGLSHPGAVLAIYSLQTVLVTGAFVFRFHSDWLLLGIYLVFAAAVLLWLRLRGNPVPAREWPAASARVFPEHWLQTSRQLHRLAFPALQGGLAAVCLAAGLLAPAPEPWLWSLVLVAVACLAVGGLVGHTPWRNLPLRLAVCLLAPVLIFRMEQGAAGWQLLGSNLLFGLLVLATVLTVRCSSRCNYRSTPLDFLILVIALVGPMLPSATVTESFGMSLIAAKIIAFLFAFEVLLSELGERRKLPWLAAGSLLSTFCLIGLIK